LSSCSTTPPMRAVRSPLIMARWCASPTGTVTGDTKNLALARATQPWALALDADEEVSPALRADIAEFFQRTDRERFAGARFPRKVWFIDRWILHGDWYPDYCVRLFHRSRARWGGGEFVHEKVETDGPVATLSGDLHHYSFPSLSSHVAKIIPFAICLWPGRRRAADVSPSPLPCSGPAGAFFALT